MSNTHSSDKQVASKRERNRIFLTHWDPDIYNPSSVPSFIAELILYNLLYEDVIVQDTNLFLNDTIYQGFLPDRQDTIRLVHELASHGCLKIRMLSEADYPEDLRATRSLQPMTARALEQSRRRSFKGQRFEPTYAQLLACRELDKIIRSNWSCISEIKKYPPENRFAANLSNVLDHREAYGLDSMEQFRIQPDVASRIADFCRAEGSWRKFLLDENHVPEKDIIGDAFYRTALYQCAKFFPESERALRNLGQSIYLAEECEREQAAGRYGDRLWEFPYRIVSSEEARNLRDEMTRIAIQPAVAELRYALRPGIGEVLAAVRKSDEFSNFQDSLVGIASSPLPEHLLRHAFEGLAARFAEEAARKMVAVNESERKFWRLAGHGIAAAGIVVGFALRQPLELGSEIVGHTVSHLGPRLSRFVRSSLYQFSAEAEIVAGVEIRCTRVRLDESERLATDQTARLT